MAYTPLVRPMNQQAPAWSYSGGDPNSYRSMLQAMDTSKARTGLEVDIFNKQQEAEERYRTEQIAVEREKIGAEQSMFSSELGLRREQFETEASQWQTEWTKRARQYDIEYARAEQENKIYGELMSRMDQLISSGQWGQI